MKKIKFLVFSLLLVFFYGSANAVTFMVKKVHEAQEYLKDTDVEFETQEIKTPVRSKVTKKIVRYHKEERVVGRQIVLAAWDESEDKVMEVWLRAPHPMPKAGFAFSVLSGEFEVEHISGRTPSKLVFKVWRGGKRLTVLAGKHLWIPPELSQSQNYELLKKRSKEAIYTPFADDLYFEEIEGETFLYSEIQKALENLRTKGVMSRSFGGKLLADVMPWEVLFNLGLNEQMDHAKFKNDKYRTAKEIANEYAFNLSNSFRWAVSSANARGAYQFTNRSRRGNTGTYDVVVGAYEDAELIEDFEEGTQDFQNMIKAAICLLDMELSKFPKDVHTLFEKDYRLGSIFSLAAYNEGFGGAKQLYQWVAKNNFQLALDKEIPQSAFVRYKTQHVRNRQGKLVKTAKKIINTETHIYIEKHLFLWSFIDEFKKQLKPGN